MVTDAATVLIRFGDPLFREFVSTPRRRPSLIRFFAHPVTFLPRRGSNGWRNPERRWRKVHECFEEIPQARSSARVPAASAHAWAQHLHARRFPNRRGTCDVCRLNCPYVSKYAAPSLECPWIRSRASLGRGDSWFSAPPRLLHKVCACCRLTAHPGSYLRHRVASGLEHRRGSADLCRCLCGATGSRTLERLFPGPSVAADASAKGGEPERLKAAGASIQSS
jgi:hypothetical protein